MQLLVTDESQGDVAVELVIVQKSDFDEEKVPDLFTVSETCRSRRSSWCSSRRW